MNEDPWDVSIEMALCEVEHVVLRIGVPYVFYQVGDCAKCANLAAKARKAYGYETDDPRYIPPSEE